MCSILDYTHMKNTIMEIFRDPSETEDSSSEVLTVKQDCLHDNVKNTQRKSFMKLDFGQGDKEGNKIQKWKIITKKTEGSKSNRSKRNVLRCLE